MTKCHTCGYPKLFHDVGTLRCPKETADKNGRRGTFREPLPPGPANWREVIAQDNAARIELLTAQAVLPSVAGREQLQPEVPARPPLERAEMAGYGGRQGVGLGRKAIAAGWSVTPLYWRAADGAEGCGVWLWRQELRALATWKRKPGKRGAMSGWEADVAYAWRDGTGTGARKANHKDLERIFDDQQQRFTISS